MVNSFASIMDPRVGAPPPGAEGMYDGEIIVVTAPRTRDRSRNRRPTVMVGPRGNVPVSRPTSGNAPCRPSTADQFFENALQISGLLGDGLAIAGVLTGNPVLAGVGVGLSYGSTALSGALNYSQGDYHGLAGDGAGAVAGLVPGGRLTRRFGGAAYDAGRDALGRFVPNWRGKQAAQDIATQGLQARAVSSFASATGCP